MQLCTDSTRIFLLLLLLLLKSFPRPFRNLVLRVTTSRISLFSPLFPLSLPRASSIRRVVDHDVVPRSIDDEIGTILFLLSPQRKEKRSPRSLISTKDRFLSRIIPTEITVVVESDKKRFQAKLVQKS